MRGIDRAWAGGREGAHAGPKLEVGRGRKPGRRRHPTARAAAGRSKLFPATRPPWGSSPRGSMAPKGAPCGPEAADESWADPAKLRRLTL